MKTILYIIIIALAAVACSEDKLSFEKVDPKYDLSDSDDALQHLKYVFNQKYGVIIIDDVDSSDYLYTGGERLDLIIGKCTKTKEEKIKILQALEKTFYINNEGFAKEYAPLKLILADSVGRMGEERNWQWDNDLMDMVEVVDTVFKSYSPYVKNFLTIVATRDSELLIEDDLTATMFGEFGEPVSFADKMLGTIIIDNILLPQLGDMWFLEFTALLGKYEAQRGGAGYIRYDFDDEVYNNWQDWGIPEEEAQFFYPSSEFPGGFDSLDKDAVMQFLYGEGFPAATKIDFFPERTSGRIKVFLQDLVPGWVKFGGLSNKEELLNTYPELKKNYLTAQELILKYTGIEI